MLLAVDLLSVLPFFLAPPLPTIVDASLPVKSPSMLSLDGGDGCERRIKLRCGSGGGCSPAIDAERALSATISGVSIRLAASLSGFFRPPRLSEDSERGKWDRNAGFKLDDDDVADTFNRAVGTIGVKWDSFASYFGGEDVCSLNSHQVRGGLLAHCLCVQSRVREVAD